MNFLQLVQRTHRKCRVSGVKPATLEVTQNAEIDRLSDWVNEAWMSIQNERQDWSWMRRSASWQTSDGQATYTVAQTGANNLGNWQMDTFRVFQTAAGTASEMHLEPVGYDWWRDAHRFSGFRDAKTIPINVTQLPDHGIGLGPAPIAGLTITGDYFAVASEMVGNAAIPDMPVQFHMAIVYRAMMFYGASEAAQEVYSEGDVEFRRLMAQVRLRELPAMEMAGPLA